MTNSYKQFTFYQDINLFIYFIKILCPCYFVEATFSLCKAQNNFYFCVKILQKNGQKINTVYLTTTDFDKTYEK